MESVGQDLGHADSTQALVHRHKPVFFSINWGYKIDGVFLRQIDIILFLYFQQLIKKYNEIIRGKSSLNHERCTRILPDTIIK
jgi:hypothetical protein